MLTIVALDPTHALFSAYYSFSLTTLGP
jgi:hypothetical protein